MGIPAAIAVTIAAGTAAALYLFPKLHGRTGGGSGSGFRIGPPWLSLIVVVAIIYVNQVLVNVYMLRMHHGNPSYINQYLPPGYFALERDGVIEALARWFPVPGILSLSVFRVQSFFELPFLVFCYLTVCRWFSPSAYRAVIRLAWPLSASATITFCLIELSLPNPYTLDDIAVRLVSGLVVPLWVARLSRPRQEADDGAPGLAGLLVFVVSALAMSVIILTVYQSALLYNLGQFRGLLPAAGAALVILVVTRLAARRLPRRPPGAGVGFVSRSLSAFLVLFAIPALPVRYALQGWSIRYVAVAATIVIITAALRTGARETLAQDSLQKDRWLRQMTVAAILGVLAGMAGYVLCRELVAHGFLARGDGSELPPVLAAAAFFLCAACACALMDARTVRDTVPEQPTSIRQH